MPRKKIIKQEETGYEYYRTYLNKGIELLDSMSRRHRRVMQTRMDFRYPQEMEIDGSNRDFSRALRDLTKELRREGYDPQYIGRREQKDQGFDDADADQDQYAAQAGFWHLDLGYESKSHDEHEPEIDKREVGGKRVLKEHDHA